MRGATNFVLACLAQNNCRGYDLVAACRLQRFVALRRPLQGVNGSACGVWGVTAVTAQLTLSQARHHFKLTSSARRLSDNNDSSTSRVVLDMKEGYSLPTYHKQRRGHRSSV